ncbi:metal-sensitive transcriptional regulator [Arthrobacter sp. CAN_C5]|uniref:metal-sensitive transcriptional regulator n=1 Tax=Arthrobacter sp. CAN_C5 TaxID=2760706 RepID=UPI001AE91C8B|nr:metal-sensing transcriptional repressor [Arthrobacter sp. CAN_C5]MBP2217078.1 DNA-binding FrmR family transcriptional regulator [Arthrobacter sp. CAN_C5]
MKMDPGQITPVLNRLKRARGQLDAVIRSVEDGEDCQVAVHNLATVSRALDKAGFAIISGTLQRILREPEKAATEEDMKVLEKLFLSLA